MRAFIVMELYLIKLAPTRIYEMFNCIKITCANIFSCSTLNSESNFIFTFSWWRLYKRPPNIGHVLKLIFFHFTWYILRCSVVFFCQATVSTSILENWIQNVPYETRFHWYTVPCNLLLVSLSHRHINHSWMLFKSYRQMPLLLIFFHCLFEEINVDACLLHSVWWSLNRSW